MILALLAAVSLWLSAGTLALTGGDTNRIAALPSIWILGVLALLAIALARAARLRADQSWPLAISLLLWLPFIPGPIPAAFLLWQGPIEAIVWMMVAGGLIAVRRLDLPGLVSDPTRAPAIAGLVIAVSAVVVFSQVRAVVPGGDEPHYLAATQSLLHDADLRVANNYANGEYLEYFSGRLEPHFLKRSSSGEIYSIHAPGVSVIVLPAFAIAGYGGAVFTMIVIAALTAALSWRLAWRISRSAGAAWAGVVAVFATAPYFFHTFTIYPEIIGAFIVTLAMWLLVEMSEMREIGSRTLTAIGAALAILPWLHTRFAVLAGVLGVIVLIRLAARARAVASIAAFLAVPIISGAAWFAFFWIIWGSPSPTAPYGADTSTSASYVLRGMIGLLLDQQYGVLTAAPVYLLALGGIVELFRRNPRLTIELTTVVLIYAVTVASYQMWWAGSAAPARFLVAILPLAVLPIAAVAAGSRRTITVLLLIVSVGLVVPRAFVEDGRFIFNNRAPLDATLDWLSQLVDLPLAVPSVHRDGGSIAIRDGVVWIALVCGAAALGGLFRRTVALRWTASAFALALAAMVATTVVWSFHGVAALTPDRSKLAAFGAFRPSWHTTAIDIAGLRLLPASDFPGALSFDVSSSAIRLNRVPAGEYEMRVTPTSPQAGVLTMFVGRNDPPIETPQLDELRGGGSPFRLRLPVAVQTLNLVTKDPGGAPAGPWLTLRPVSVRIPANRGNAVRATRYAHARAFFLDQWAYLEPGGFWTRANGTADVVIDSDDGTRATGLPISITAGAMPTSVEVSSGAWRESWSLTAGQRQDVVLPPSPSGVWPLRIRSGAGFRPSEREPGNSDVRLLAAWIAIH